MRSSSPAPIARRQPSPPPGRESGSRSSNPPILFRTTQFPIPVARAFSRIIGRPTINLEEMLQAERDAIVEVGTERDLDNLRECRTNLLRSLLPRERAAYRAFLLVITAAYVRRDQFIEAQNALGALLIYDRQDPAVAWVSNALRATKDAIQTARQTPGIDPAQLSSQLEPALVLP